MFSTQILLSALLVGAASAVPQPDVGTASVDITSTIKESWESWSATQSSADGITRRSGDATNDKRCEWSDGHGPMLCIVFGDGSAFHNRDRVTIKASNFEYGDWLDCESEWTTFFTPLPWTVDIHAGNACNGFALPAAWWDAVWIKYSAEYLDVPLDTRCGPVDNGYGRRCIISI